MKGRMFTEMTALTKVRKQKCRVDVHPLTTLKTITIPKEGVGIKTWGVIDYLTHGDNKPFTAYILVIGNK